MHGAGDNKELMAKLKFPVKRPRQYGGTIMQEALSAVFSECSGFTLLHFNTNFILPVENETQVEHIVEMQGKGSSIKYFTVQTKQEETRAVTTCIFTKKEDSQFKLNSLYELPIQYEPQTVSEFWAELIANENSIGQEEAQRKYEHAFTVLSHLESMADLNVIENKDKYIIRMQMKLPIESTQDNACFITYISDLLLVQTAAKMVGYPWYESQQAFIATLQQSADFNDKKLEKDGIYYFIGECNDFYDGKANISAKIVNSVGEVICAMTQLVLLRIYKPKS
ncbi:hypothetical protein ENBRE01_1051 [Enteropsectra breve]|nr:hypothetical protein ENBRE01_1051 [Enteropsectra breve]